jgi:hypothetical protein
MGSQKMNQRTFKACWLTIESGDVVLPASNDLFWNYNVLDIEIDSTVRKLESATQVVTRGLRTLTKNVPSELFRSP